MNIRILTSEVSGISSAGRTVGFEKVAEIMRRVVTSSILHFIAIVNLVDSYYIRNRIDAFAVAFIQEFYTSRCTSS